MGVGFELRQRRERKSAGMHQSSLGAADTSLAIGATGLNGGVTMS
jgi:hypothetical protein